MVFNLVSSTLPCIRQPRPRLWRNGPSTHVLLCTQYVPGNKVFCIWQPCARDSGHKIAASAHGMGSGCLAVDAMVIGCLGVDHRVELFFILSHFRGWFFSDLRFTIWLFPHNVGISKAQRAYMEMLAGGVGGPRQGFPCSLTSTRVSFEPGTYPRWKWRPGAG